MNEIKIHASSCRNLNCSDAVGWAKCLQTEKQAQLAQAQARSREQDARIEKLEQALKEIASPVPDDECPNEDDPDSMWFNIAMKRKRLARAALEAEKGSKD